MLWQNPDLQGLSLEDHAFFSPLPEDDPGSYRETTKTFLGERYGGDGLGSNGGGVRCGLEGGLQVKGIGKNSLAGSDTDFFHSYGGATLNEAILESIWGEACQMALPYDGVRTLGILGTGTRVPLRYPKAGEDKTTPRVLIVRQSPLRPAHYMRAVFFRPQHPQAIPTSDVKRTAAAVRRIHIGFASAYGWDPQQPLSAKLVNDGLLEMGKRFAWQIAAARAKRIMHGSLTASNISIDGRWMDFGSISAVSDYGRILIPRGAPDFLHEEQMLRGSLADFHFYLRKYLPSETTRGLLSYGDFWGHFRSVFDSRLETEFCKLTGIPESEIQMLPQILRETLYRAMRRITAQGNRAPFTILSFDNEYVPVMPCQMGTFHLNTILAHVIQATTINEADAAVTGLLYDDDLRKELVDSYWKMRDTYILSIPVDKRQTSLTCMVENGVRVNQQCPDLYRTNLYPAIASIVVNKGNVSEFIDDVLDKARRVFCDATASDVRGNEARP